MDNIPNEVVLMVLESNVLSTRDQLAFGQTSKRFHELSKRVAYRHHILTFPFDEAKVEALLKNEEYVRHLGMIFGNGGLMYSGLSSQMMRMIDHFQGLTSLMIMDAGQLGGNEFLKGMAHILVSKPMLVELRIRYCYLYEHIGPMQPVLDVLKKGVVAKIRKLDIYIGPALIRPHGASVTNLWILMSVFKNATEHVETFSATSALIWVMQNQRTRERYLKALPKRVRQMEFWKLPKAKTISFSYGSCPESPIFYLDARTLGNVKTFVCWQDFTAKEKFFVTVSEKLKSFPNLLQLIIWEGHRKFILADIENSADPRKELATLEEQYAHKSKVFAEKCQQLETITWIPYQKGPWRVRFFVLPGVANHGSEASNPEASAKTTAVQSHRAIRQRPRPADITVHGAGGGPSEEGVTGFLVRSMATDWAPGSILAVDAGSHLASIIKILENTPGGQHPTTPTTPNSSKRRPPSVTPLQTGHRELTLQTTPSSPPSHFQGASLPFKTPRANAAHIFRELIGGYCLTHPHLDHISGLVINTAGIVPGNPKKVIAALPPTIEALKAHVFNDIIWPNMTDENGGVGFLTLRRLVDASVVDGKIEYRGVVDGLSVQAWPVSHGHCMHKHTHRGSDAQVWLTDGFPREKSQAIRAASGLNRRQTWQKKCVNDSSCFFIRDDFTEKEILIFGDVEADSVSISEPRRNVYIWNYAAEKMHRGVLSAIFIESSYDITQKDDQLYGHMTPKHVVEELQVLASKVLLHREREARRFSMPKRRRTTDNPDSILKIDPFDAGYGQAGQDGYNSASDDSDVPRSPTDLKGLPEHKRKSPGGKRRRNDGEPTSPPRYTASPTSITGGDPVDTSTPLKGLRVVIIHVKDDFDDDADVRQSILNNLIKLEAQAGLGCTFEMAETGGSMFF
ncbi:hypothetical protein Dda_2217 [Drechslerella dactyloides]|uniref:Uncharacterized protein n=1 Tax=Drechslerella dactyloides TaxID=74499 RepID=A0AAD6NM44_DREDA|nr:hypothetical protein Dda_2217 [Drechslerella dactyloides]